MFDETRFLRLPESSQHLLEFLSIIYTPITANSLSKLSPVAIPLTQLHSLLNELVQTGWLTVSKTQHYACAPGIGDALTQHSVRGGRFDAWAKVVDLHLSPEQPKNWWAGQQVWTHVEAALRDLRLQVLLGDNKNVQLLLERAGKQYAQHPLYQPHPWLHIWGNPPDNAWFELLPQATFLQLIAPVYLTLAAQDMSIQVVGLWQYCQKLLHDHNADVNPLWEICGATYYEQMFLRGQSDETSRMPTSIQQEQALVFAAARQLIQGHPQATVQTYQSGLRLLRRRHASRRMLFNNRLEIFYVLALLLDGQDKSLKEALHYIRERTHEEPIYVCLAYYAEARLTGRSPVLTEELEQDQQLSLQLLFAIVVRYWLGQTVPAPWLERVEAFYQQAQEAGYTWLAGEYAALLARLLPENDQRKAIYTALAEAIHSHANTQPLLSLYQPQAEWERSLQALQRLGAAVGVPLTPVNTSTERLVWVLEKERQDDAAVLYTLVPKLQKNTKGSWSDGRNVALKRLVNEPETLPFLTEEDKRICQTIKFNGYSTQEKNYELCLADAWPHLIGHPRVYWAEALNTPLDIRQGREELLILREQGQLRIKLFPELPVSQCYQTDSYHVVEETTLQLRLYKLTSAVLQLHQILGRDGLLVPQEAEASVRQTLETLAPMIAIQSDIAGMDNAEFIPPDERLHLHMLPWGNGLRLLMRVQPFGSHGPAYPPGMGRPHVLAEIEQKLFKTTRQLAQERQQAESLLLECPALACWEDVGEDLLLSEAEICLEALGQLHALGERIVLAWPEGERLRLTQTVGVNQLALRMRQAGDWFELDGQLQVNADLVLSLRQLLDLSRNAAGRFIPLADGQYLALTRQFQKRLDALRAYAEDGDNGLKIGALAGLNLESFFQEVGELELDPQWQAQLARLKRIRDSQAPIPTELQVELRDYQEEGYRWMMRLAEWGVGGCLADDMGLGKTVQTLTMLLARAHRGPALVVAPVSVCNNWYSECQRFAPSLRQVFYQGRERQQLLDGVQAQDLVITSYGLLQQDVEAFQAVHWGTIVLDEAQAIKNTATKRTQAAYQLQGEFRLVTTGTPIENHLGELWSLFRFLNPGLLFSQQTFSERFMVPLETQDADKARQHLRKLVQPFILRRTKNQVLQELPPRTDITLTVKLSAEEQSLYEALRQQALARFAQAPTDVEHKHLEVLAEITRLRLAACHPQLAMPGSGLPSSKLQMFGELVTELRENQHKVLVFSQFVKHLELIRAWLDEQAIPYQYLDGSTPREQRQERVEAFQRGEGDVFLISLKAGGFGLNLTAADYVIHMDPWWNPAVEDQASDRAHRIGQQRPVTVYRLVAENTIEEKIVKLHQFKRDLADSLLEGSDISGKLSSKDMLAMIRGNSK